ncbi:MAG: hypothetical protein RMK52_09440 [Chitinophagales bacterium]|nr:hypothetical protein [Chitinophagales bacterium]MDW8394448.1 hypothetical protein [Chitinophagales bacterium]
MNTEETTLEQRWLALQRWLGQRFGREPDLNAVLFLIGIQETGFRRSSFSKEEKQDLMHVGVCTVLSAPGYYRLRHMDEEGWPHFELVKPLPPLQLEQQEQLLKQHVLHYFDQKGWSGS